MRGRKIYTTIENCNHIALYFITIERYDVFPIMLRVQHDYGDIVIYSTHKCFYPVLLLYNVFCIYRILDFQCCIFKKSEGNELEKDLFQNVGKKSYNYTTSTLYDDMFTRYLFNNFEGAYFGN